MMVSSNIRARILAGSIRNTSSVPAIRHSRTHIRSKRSVAFCCSTRAMCALGLPAETRRHQPLPGYKCRHRSNRGTRPFSGNFGRGLSPADNQMVFESAAQLNAAGRARSASLVRGAIRRRKAPVAPRYFGCSAQAGWPAIWYGIISCPGSLRLAITALPGAALRLGNGRSRADPPG